MPPDPSPMDFSAWFEAFVGGRWYTFDARHNHPRIGRVTGGYRVAGGGSSPSRVIGLIAEFKVVRAVLLGDCNRVGMAFKMASKARLSRAR